MNQRVVTGLLTAGCIALAGAGYMTYKNQDRTAPEIKVDRSEKIAYTEGEDYGKLLEGVTAQDDKDGDLTSEVFVEKGVPVSKKKAVVYYGVTDKANNVGTASREVTYQAAEDSDAAEDTAQATASEEASEDTTQKTKKKSKKAKAKKTAEEKKAEETAQDAAAAEQQSTDQQSEALQPNGTRPAMKLAEEAKTIARGTSFNALNEVTDAVDDKDDRDTLFRGLHIDGNYNVNQAGTYTLQYYVQDSDGNTSDPITFTLTVEEQTETSGDGKKEPDRKTDHTDPASGIGDLHRDCGRQWDAAEEVPDLPDRDTGSTLWCDTYPAVSEE